MHSIHLLNFINEMTHVICAYCSQLQKISAIQKLMVDEGVVANLIPLLGSKDDDIFRETLALLCSLLFNANTNMQVSGQDVGLMF